MLFVSCYVIYVMLYLCLCYVIYVMFVLFMRPVFITDFSSSAMVNIDFNQLLVAYAVWIWDSVANILEIHASSIFRVSVNIEASCSSETLAELPTSTWCKHPAAELMLISVAYSFQIIMLTECTTSQVAYGKQYQCETPQLHMLKFWDKYITLHYICLAIYVTSLSSVTTFWTCVRQPQEVSIT